MIFLHQKSVFLPLTLADLSSRQQNLAKKTENRNKLRWGWGIEKV